jgi:NAD(P)-dependent dehydrogenase (short-subunit alcohol dehydrogenase family)
MDFKNKTALITGGTKGIGLGIAEKMLAQGMRVMITGRSTIGVNEKVAELQSKYSGQVMGHSFDVVSLDDNSYAVSQLLARWGQLDVLVANAGVGHFASIEDLTETQWKEVIDVNLTGVFNSVKASVDALKESQGYIMTIASLAGTNFFAKGAAYNASKFGLVGFTQAIMLDLRQYGVKCTTIMPGSVATYFNDHKPGPQDDWKIQPEDIGQMVIDLLNMHPRTLPSKIEVRPSQPPSK